jgi:hypothetical protein
MHFFVIMFLSLISVMFNKYTSYITVLQCWNTSARKHPTERESSPHCKKRWRPLLYPVERIRTTTQSDDLFHAPLLPPLQLFIRNVFLVTHSVGRTRTNP